MSFQQVLKIAIPAITFLLMVLVGIDLKASDFLKVRSSAWPGSSTDGIGG